MPKQNFTYRLYSSYVKKNGEASLEMLITIGSETKPFSLKESWPNSLFDKKAGIIKPRQKNDLEHERICIKINRFKAELYELKKKIDYNESYKLSFQKLRMELKLETARGNFPDLMLAMIEERKVSSDPKVKIVESTARHHQSSARKLAAYHKKKLPVPEIGYEYLCDYAAYLVDDEEMTTNSMRNQIKNIKTYLGYSLKRGINVDLTYKQMQVKEMKVPITFLEQFELNRLIYLYDVGHLTGYKKQVLAASIFSSLTGLRISDLYRACHAWVINNNYMQFMPWKNHERNPKIITVPLQPIAQKYIQNKRGLFFNLPSEKEFREILKEHCSAVDILKNVKPHSMRHTFGHLYIKWGGLLEALSEIMGHEDLETTRIYVHITKDQKREGAKKMETALLDMSKMRVAN